MVIHILIREKWHACDRASTKYLRILNPARPNLLKTPRPGHTEQRCLFANRAEQMLLWGVWIRRRGMAGQPFLINCADSSPFTLFGTSCSSYPPCGIVFNSSVDFFNPRKGPRAMAEPEGQNPGGAGLVFAAHNNHSPQCGLPPRVRNIDNPGLYYKGRKGPTTLPLCQKVGGPWFRALSGVRECLLTRPGHESGVRDSRGRPAVLVRWLMSSWRGIVLKRISTRGRSLQF